MYHPSFINNIISISTFISRRFSQYGLPLDVVDYILKLTFNTVKIHQIFNIKNFVAYMYSIDPNSDYLRYTSVNQRTSTDMDFLYCVQTQGFIGLNTNCNKLVQFDLSKLVPDMVKQDMSIRHIYIYNSNFSEDELKAMQEGKVISLATEVYEMLLRR